MNASPDSFKAIQRAFAAHIRDPDNHPAPEGIEDRRMAIYRELFFKNVSNLLGGNFPVLKRLYGDDAWTAMMRDFYAHHQSHTPLFPELPREFLRFVEERRGAERGDPPFLLELAHYEWVELALQLDEGDIDATPHDPNGDLLRGRPVLSPVAWLLSYQWPVHRIRPDYRPAEPPEQPTHLIVYRQRDDKVRFMQINAVTARLVQLLDDDEPRTGQELIETLATELGRPADTLVEPARRIFSDLHSRSIVLGTTA